MNNQNTTVYLFAALALALFVIGKNKGKGGAGGVSTGGCNSALSHTEMASIAQGLREFFENSYLWDMSDYAPLYALCAKIPDACAVAGIASAFGQLDSYFSGSGGLAYWLGKCPENVQNEVRPHFFNALSF